MVAGDDLGEGDTEDGDDLCSSLSELSHGHHGHHGHLLFHAFLPPSARGASHFQRLDFVRKYPFPQRYPRMRTLLLTTKIFLLCEGRNV